MHPEFESRERWVKAMKEAAVAAAAPEENDDIPPVVDILRNGRSQVTIMCRDVNRDQGLHAALVGTSGFAGDELWLMLDSHMSNTMTNPVTGERWGPGEMQAGCEGAEMCATGIITDCLMLIRGTRDGSMQMVALPYHVHKTERTVRWVDEGKAEMDPDKEGSSFDGYVVDAVRQAFDTPITKDIIASSPSLTIGERLQAAQIARSAAVLTLQRQGHTVALAEDSLSVP